MTTENQTTKLITPKGQSYWNNTGIYQKEYGILKELVPSSGEADSVHGEMIRCVGRLYYDFCNNGNCNAIDHIVETETHDCSECNGSGEVEERNDETGETEMVSCGDCCGSGEYEEDTDGDAFINPFFKKMIDFLRQKVSDKTVIDNLEAFMLDNSKGYAQYKFDDEEMNVYDLLTDEVVYICLTTQNESRIPQEI
jgi:hypothetical protein